MPSIQHMILQEDDGKAKKTGKMVMWILLALVSLVFSFVAIGLAAKALTDITDLRNEMSALREINRDLQLRNGVQRAVHSTPAALRRQDGSKPPQNYNELIQNLTTLRNEISDYSATNTELIRTVENKQATFQLQAGRQLTVLNRTSRLVGLQISSIKRKQKRFDNELTNLTEVFNERDAFHHNRTQGTIYDQSLLEDRVNQALADVLELEESVSNNTNAIEAIKGTQQIHEQHLSYLSDYTMNATLRNLQRFEHVDSVSRNLVKNMEDLSANFTSELFELMDQVSSQFQQMEAQILAKQNSSTALPIQEYVKQQQRAFSHRLILDQQANYLHADFQVWKGKVINNTRSIRLLKGIVNHLSWHAQLVDNALRGHSARINATEQNFIDFNTSESSGSSEDQDLAEVIIDTRAQATKVQKQLVRLEKDFCESVGLVYGDQCIRMAYARGPDVNHTTAEQICESQGGTLANIDHDDMVDLVAEMVNATYRGNAISVELWIANKYQNGNIVIPNGRQTAVTKWLPGFPNNNLQDRYMGLYVGLDHGFPVGVFNTASHVPHLTPLCSFRFDQ